MYFRNLVPKPKEPDDSGVGGGADGEHYLKLNNLFFLQNMKYDLNYELFIFTSPKFQTTNDAAKQRLTYLKMIFFELGNGFCNRLLNTEACCYDGGDCLLPYSCPTCPALKLMDEDVFVLDEKMSIREEVHKFNTTHDRRRFGDGICDEEYNR